MKETSIIKRILTVSVCLILINIILSIGSIFILNKIKHKSEYLQGNVIQQALAASRLKLATVQVQQWLTDISATRGAKGFDDGFSKAEEWAKKYKEELALLKQKADDEKTIKLLEELDKSFDSYYLIGKEMAKLYIENGPEAGNKFMAKFDPAAERITTELEELNSMLISPISGHFLEIFNLISFYEQLFLYIALGVFAASVTFVAFNLKSIIRSMSRIIANLRNSSSGVYNESERLSSLAESFSQAAIQQASSIQETSASLEEITSMINIGNEHVQSAADTTQKSLSSAENGKNIVEDMVQAIGTISTVNDLINQQINETNAEISKIINIIDALGNKTKVINDIVFQTKLLSFNASVEAARAGEAGKGFAVVAEEVGNLAAMSGKAAEEITEMLAESTSTVQNIVETSKKKMEIILNESKNKLAVGIDVSSQCQLAFEEILSNTQNVSSMVNEVFMAAKEQALGITEINKAIAQLDHATQQNAHNANEIANTSAELNVQSDELSQLVTDLTQIVHGRENKIQAKISESSSAEQTFTFDGAVKAHRDWKQKLRVYMDNPDGSLKESVVCRDDNCALGKWIYSEGTHHESMSEFKKLKPSHAKFHQIAGNIVADINNKKKVDVSIIQADSEFGRISKEVIENIIELKIAIHQKTRARGAAPISKVKSGIPKSEDKRFMDI